MPEDVQPETQPPATPAAPHAPAATPPSELAVQDARALAMQAQQRLLQTGHFGMQVQVGPAPNELLAKLEPAHFTRLIDSAEAEQKRSHERKQSAFWGSLVGGIGGFLLLCWLFLHYGKTELLKDILLLFTGLVGGFLSGLGFGKVTKKSAD
ncbi:MAG TPA: hypothetical protein VFW87_07635 [Pirellulales bacterium]|nr:hypothetical protein [Pirellulales bacterium]